MQPISDIRRERLRQLIQKYGTLAELNEKLGRPRTDATLSQIVNQSKDSKTGKPKGMGTRLARSIEETLELQSGWMDAPLNPELTPLSSEAREIAIALDEFDPETKDHLLRMWWGNVEFVRSKAVSQPSQPRHGGHKGG